MNISGKSILRDPAFPHKVSICMLATNVTIHWNSTLIEVVDLFGLPGDRYITDFTDDETQVSVKNYGTITTDFYFKDIQDLLLFRLKFSDVVYDNA
jgi:hypothetical protein